MRWGSILLATAGVWACGGNVGVADFEASRPSDPGAAGEGPGIVPVPPPPSEDAGPGPDPSPDVPPGAPDAEAPFEDPGCPDAPRVPGPRHCEPFETFPGCGPGERCIPYVTYADDCGTEEFGTACVAEGPGRQGDECIHQSCSTGHVCVTTGEGSQCVTLCRLDFPGDCPPGLLCSRLDVDGFYVCF